MRGLIPALPPSGQLAASRFEPVTWSAFYGESGGYGARSLDGSLEAIAERIAGGWRFWLVRVSDGETLHSEDVCAA